MTDKEKDTAQNGAETPQRAVIIDDSEYRPELDPGSPEFDPKQYAEAIEAAGGMKKMTADIADSLHRIGEIVGENLAINQADLLTDFAEAALDSMKAARDAQLDAIQEQTDTLMGISKAAVEDMESIKGPILNAAHEQMKAAPDAIHEAVENLLSGGEEARHLIEAFALSDAFKEMVSALKRLGELIGEQRDALQAAQSRGPEIQSLFPYLLEEFEQVRKEGKGYFDGMTNAGIFEAGYDENGNPTNSLFSQILEKARKHKREDEATEIGETETALATLEQAAALLESISPTAHAMLNNPLINKMQEAPAIDAGPFDLTVSKAKGKRKEITAYTMINYEADEMTGVSTAGKKLSEYERQVFDAITSLFLEAQKTQTPPIFTPDMIYRAMPGGGEKASAQQKGAITRAIDKLRRTHVYFDATEEMRKRGVIGEGKTFKLDDYFLSATRLEVTAKHGGQTVTAYKINVEPIMLTYSRATKQILTVKPAVLDVRKTKKGKPEVELLPMNPDRQAMTGYMMRRIEIMRHDKKEGKSPAQSDTILFTSLFNATGQDASDKVINKRNRDFCFQVLEYWKAIGHIRDYKKQEKGRSITGVQIVL